MGAIYAIIEGGHPTVTLSHCHTGISKVSTLAPRGELRQVDSVCPPTEACGSDCCVIQCMECDSVHDRSIHTYTLFTNPSPRQHTHTAFSPSGLLSPTNHAQSTSHSRMAFEKLIERVQALASKGVSEDALESISVKFD